MNLAHSKCLWLSFMAVLVCGAPARAEWVDWIAEASIDFEYNDNLPLSAFERDERDDVSWHPLARVGRAYQLTDRTRAQFVAQITGDIFATFSALDAVEVGGELSLQHKFGVGNAPFLRGTVYGGYKDVDDRQRSGERVQAGVLLGKRFSPRFDAALGYTFAHQGGNNGTIVVPTIPTDVFDLQFHTISAVGNFLLLPDLLFTAGYAFRTGEIASHCTVANVGTVLATENVKAIHFDGVGTDPGVFGGCVYRLDADAHAATASFNYGITERIAIEAGYRFQHGKADFLDYTNHGAVISLLFRY